MGRHYFFILAAFIVAAALLKAGVPGVPVALGIGMAGLANLLWNRRRQKQRARPPVVSTRR